ncbi:hypothetical protein ACMA1D_01910 [Streptomyces sp. 796.1]|uniref:hypothetical protein n=1 Tax=Streptomyces sp. 796.1 TaxID=3163029 RepID=UPI0039C8D4F8
MLLESLTLDYQGIRAYLRGPAVREAIDGYAAAVATEIRAAEPRATVTVRSYTTDRGGATVAVEDVRAMAWQARDGLLTRAAGRAGLEVKAWQR